MQIARHFGSTNGILLNGHGECCWMSVKRTRFAQLNAAAVPAPPYLDVYGRWLNLQPFQDFDLFKDTKDKMCSRKGDLSRTYLLRSLTAQISRLFHARINAWGPAGTHPLTLPPVSRSFEAHSIIQMIFSESQSSLRMASLEAHPFESHHWSRTLGVAWISESSWLAEDPKRHTLKGSS